MNATSNKLVRTVTKHGGELVRLVSKNSPVILTGCAVAGAFAAVGLAVKATKPALKHIEEEKVNHRDRIIIIDGDEREDDELTQEEIDSIKLKPLEVVGAVWKDYIPTAIALAGTTACIVGAHSISAKRTAAMAALYTMSEQALKDYKDQAEKIVGRGKAEAIKDAVAEKDLERHPYNPNAPVSLSRGDVMCFDRRTGRYFGSNMEKIQRTVAELNKQMAYGERVSVNDFYYALQSPDLDGIEGGDDIGWCTENELNLEFTSKLMSDGTPVLCIGHRNAPSAWYYD